MTAASNHVHVGLAYSSIEEFLSAAVPFVHAGLASNEPVLAVSTPANHHALRRALGDESPAVHFLDSQRIYRNPLIAASSILAHLDSLGECLQSGFRMLAEPVHPSLSAKEVERLVVNDSASNAFMQDVKSTVMCAYDVRIPAVEADGVHCAHPFMAQGATIVPSMQYLEPLAFHALRSNSQPRPAQDAAVSIPFTLDTLRSLRQTLSRFAASKTLEAGRVRDLVVSACEAAANAIEHGSGEGVLYAWAEDDEIICEIENFGGMLVDPFLGHRLPALDGERGRGFWLMRQLCDWVDVRSDHRRTTVRLHMSLLNHESAGTAVP